MRTHSDIVKAIPDAAAFANRRGLSIHTVRSWAQRNSIPGEQWQALADDGVAKLEELALAAHIAAERAKVAA